MSHWIMGIFTGLLGLAGLLMAGATMPPELLNPEIAIRSGASKQESWLSRLTRRWL